MKNVSIALCLIFSLAVNVHASNIEDFTLHDLQTKTSQTYYDGFVTGSTWAFHVNDVTCPTIVTGGMVQAVLDAHSRDWANHHVRVAILLAMIDLGCRFTGGSPDRTPKVYQ